MNDSIRKLAREHYIVDVMVTEGVSRKTAELLTDANLKVYGPDSLNYLVVSPYTPGQRAERMWA